MSDQDWFNAQRVLKAATLKYIGPQLSQRGRNWLEWISAKKPRELRELEACGELLEMALNQQNMADEVINAISPKKR